VHQNRLSFPFISVLSHEPTGIYLMGFFNILETFSNSLKCSARLHSFYKKNTLTKLYFFVHIVYRIHTKILSSKTVFNIDTNKPAY